MLLVLDDSLAKALNGTDELLKKPVLSALENIALVRREGKHWIFAKPQTLITFKKCLELCERTRSVYSELLDDDPGYPPPVIRRVEVTALDTGPSSRMDGKCKVIRIPARYFGDSKLIQETVLLAENLLDTDFYLKVAETYLVWKKLNRHIKIRCERLPGGGDTTFNLYKSILEALPGKRFCLCILDSDKESPHCPMGGTAKKIEEGVEKMEEGNKPFGEHLVIGVRDIENLIPTVWYSQVSEKSDRMRCVEFLEKLESSAIAEARKYVDLKEGLTGEKILQAKTIQVLQDWLKWLKQLQGSSTTVINQNQQSLKTEVVNRLTELEKLTGATIFETTCIKAESCQEKQNKKLCQCIITTGLGDKILAVVVNLLETMTAQQIAKEVDESLKPEWEKIGELVTAWCCVAPIMSC